MSEARIQEQKTPIDARRSTLKKKVNRTLIVKSTVWFAPATSPVLAAASFEVKTDDDDVLKSSKEVEMVVGNICNNAQSKLPRNN